MFSSVWTRSFHFLFPEIPDFPEDVRPPGTRLLFLDKHFMKHAHELHFHKEVNKCLSAPFFFPLHGLLFKALSIGKHAIKIFSLQFSPTSDTMLLFHVENIPTIYHSTHLVVKQTKVMLGFG